MSFPDIIYYESGALNYELGKMLWKKYQHVQWVEIESHNNIPELRSQSNSAFPQMKQHLIIGVRKTNKYTENHKVSDYLVPYTSSGCIASCLYCYLVCNYNKCSYLRLFVNREEMMNKIMKTQNKSEKPLCFEIGSNSDLVLENTLTDNLCWTIEQFSDSEKGSLTFPTKFSMVEPLLNLNHRGKVIFRMSVNPQEIIRKIELGTSPLDKRIDAINSMCEAGYPVGILLAPIIFVDNWKILYGELIDVLSDKLSEKVKRCAFIEVIFMTYSFVQNAINTEAYPKAPPFFSRELMTGRGQGKYCYKPKLRNEGEEFLRNQISEKIPDMEILYIV